MGIILPEPDGGCLALDVDHCVYDSLSEEEKARVDRVLRG